jgi:hypothetical protein
MVSLHLHFTPPASGIQSQLFHLYEWEGEQYEEFVHQLPASEDGEVACSIGTTHPELTYFVKVPEQRIFGTVYLEYRTTFFDLLEDREFSLELVPKTGPNPPPAKAAALILLPLIVGAVAVREV